MTNKIMKEVSKLGQLSANLFKALSLVPYSP